MIDEGIWLERENTQELVAYLRDEADPGDVLRVLILALRRKLGEPVPEITEGEDKIDALERFFDVALVDVTPLPPVAYTGEELSAFAIQAAELIQRDRIDSIEDEPEEERADMLECWNADRDGFILLSAVFRHSIAEGRDFYSMMDTYQRGWLFSIRSIDENRYYYGEA